MKKAKMQRDRIGNMRLWVTEQEINIYLSPKRKIRAYREGKITQ